MTDFRRWTRVRAAQVLWAAAVAALVSGGAIGAESQRTELPDPQTLGPQVGARVPSFSLQDQRGTPRTLASLMGPKGVMLVFFRSADW